MQSSAIQYNQEQSNTIKNNPIQSRTIEYNQEQSCTLETSHKSTIPWQLLSGWRWVTPTSSECTSSIAKWAVNANQGLTSPSTIRQSTVVGRDFTQWASSGGQLECQYEGTQRTDWICKVTLSSHFSPWIWLCTIYPARLALFLGSFTNWVKCVTNTVIWTSRYMYTLTLGSVEDQCCKQGISPHAWGI